MVDSGFRSWGSGEVGSGGVGEWEGGGVGERVESFSVYVGMRGRLVW